MNLTRLEQETIFLYNQEEKIAFCTTYDPAMIRKLDGYCRKSTAITVTHEEEGCKEYQFPKSWIKVKMPKELTEEQRQNLADRMRSLRKETNDAN